MQIKWHEGKVRVLLALCVDMEEFTTSWRYHKQLPERGEMRAEPQRAEKRNGLVGIQKASKTGREGQREHHCGVGEG